MSGEEKAIPATPTALSVAAPAMPATCVPWPTGSVGVPSTQPPPRQTALEAEMRLERSLCVASTPVSTIPIGTPIAGAKVPGKSDQPPRASMVESAHCCE